MGREHPSQVVQPRAGDHLGAELLSSRSSPIGHTVQSAEGAVQQTEIAGSPAVAIASREVAIKEVTALWLRVACWYSAIVRGT